MSASLLALLDDIASLLDDVAAMTQVAARKSAAVADDVAALTKVSAQKAAGVLGDDLALNAQQVAGVRADREWPVVWAVAKGSLANKAILVPAALAISALAPWLVTPLLMAGGAFLCFEGAEKLAHKLLHSSAKAEEKPTSQAADLDWAELEKTKVKGAIRTDFVLSAEIIAITLGNVAGQPLPTQLAVMTGIALLMTAGVYGAVAAIVKLDDAGLFLSQCASRALQLAGRAILRLAPWLMKLLTVVGTAAMFTVGGGIIAHGVPALAQLAHLARGGWLGLLLDMATGLFVGMLLVGAVQVRQRLWPRRG